MSYALCSEWIVTLFEILPVQRNQDILDTQLKKGMLITKSASASTASLSQEASTLKGTNGK